MSEMSKQGKYNKEKPYLFGVKSYKNFYAIQQGVLIALLNNFCTITLKKPRKQAKITQVYPTIKTICIDNEELDIPQIVNHICQPLYNSHVNNVNKKQTAQRRFEKNKKVCLQNLLIDILMEKGFFFESKMARQSKKTFRLERIQKIFYNNKLILDFDDFITKGNEIINYLCGLFVDQLVIKLEKNNPDLLNISNIVL